MFRTSFVHHQEDSIVQAALCALFFMRFCKQSGRLGHVLLMVTIRYSKHVKDKKE
jgi:hypothetical protein